MKESPEYQKTLYEYLSGFITPHKLNRFHEVIRNRTRHLTVVLEDIYQPHNASAVLRTCDCLGIQDIHVIENRNRYTLSEGVALGSSKWVNLLRYNTAQDNTADCLGKLRSLGYIIVAATPHQTELPVRKLPVANRLALLFGTEMEGLSPTATDSADLFVRIPMYGFTESYNISVSAAIILYELIHRIRESGVSWELTEDEKTEILLSWARNVVKRADLHEKDFRKKYR